MAVPTTSSIAMQLTEPLMDSPKHRRVQKLAMERTEKHLSVHVACCHESDQEDNIGPDFESDSDMEFMSIAPHKG